MKNNETITFTEESYKLNKYIIKKEFLKELLTNGYISKDEFFEIEDKLITKKCN